MKRQKWVDVWDGTDFKSQTQATSEEPAALPKFSGPDGIWNKETGIGQSALTDDEPRTPPATQGSVNYDIRDTSVSQNGDTTHWSQLSKEGNEPLGIAAYSSEEKPKVDFQTPVNSAPGETRPKLWGLQQSRWAQGDVNKPQDGHNGLAGTIDLHQTKVASVSPSDKRDRTMLPDVPSLTASVSKTPQDAIDKTSCCDKAKPIISETEFPEPGQEHPLKQNGDEAQVSKIEDETQAKQKAKSGADHETTPAVLDSNESPAALGSYPSYKPYWVDQAHFSDATEAENRQDAVHLASHDPRADTPEQNWNETRRPKPTKGNKDWDDDSIHSDDPHIITGRIKKFLRWWQAGVPDVKSDFLEQNIPGHHHRDVDTETGTLIEPVDYLNTHRPEEGNWTEYNRTTQDVIDRLMSQLEERRRKSARKRTRREEAERRATIEQEMAKCVNEDQVKVPCHIRPATVDDMEAVAAIYNHEVEHSYSVVDTQPVSVARFRTLLDVCKTLHQPFVVAVAGWHYPDVDSSKEPILGFCLVDALEKGIMGSRETSTKRCGKVTLIVHPEWRQKKIGTALLDTIIISCSINHSPRRGYQWVCSSDEKAYTLPPHGHHPWETLQMDVLTRSEDNKEKVKKKEKWIIDLLEAKFTFLLTKHDDHIYFHPREEMGSHRYLDRLTFEHYCRVGIRGF